MAFNNDKAKKEALDKQTSYLTFLPHMDEGFHMGYQSTPGVVSDRNRRPRQWLESMARYMQTPRQDVGYSIPDILAGEQQLRRMARLRPEEALQHQQMIDWRACLALLLLWDTFAQDSSWPVLELRRLSGGETEFSASVAAALSPVREGDGLSVFILRSARETDGNVQPIALLSRAMAIAPAAQMGDLSSLLPRQIRWYDRVAQRFVDPCGNLDEPCAFLLASRLRVLVRLCEESQWNSPLCSPDQQLSSLLARFADDLAAPAKAWRSRVESGDADALHALRLRTLAACAFEGVLPVEHRTIRASEAPLAGNLLLHAHMGDALPAAAQDVLECWALEGVPFACHAQDTLFMPAGALDEKEITEKLEDELALLTAYDPRWRAAASAALRSLRAQTRTRTGLCSCIPDQLRLWADELDAMPVSAAREMTVDEPMEDCPAAMRTLLYDMLGMTDAVSGVLSDALLLLEGDAPYGDAAWNERCRLDGGAWYAVPPLSPACCRWLMETAETDGLYAPLLDAQSLCFERTGDAIAVSLRIVRRSRQQGAAPVSAVTFRRSYRIGEKAQQGAAVLLAPQQRPGVTVWPNARLSPGLWKQYFVFAHGADSVSVQTFTDEGWQAGEVYRSGDRVWHTASTPHFPCFVALRRGDVSLGALPNDVPQRISRHESAAAIAIDFGSISTTVMLRQGDRVQPAVLPECMHATLLARADHQHALRDAFLPPDVLLPASSVEATYYSLMDMFSDDMERWTHVLRDGHIYYRTSLEALMDKSAGALYYDLKWGGEPYSQRVMRLFLKQVMLQAALAARLSGSSSATWRISMPNALPPHKQESYLETMRALAREVAAECGLPLTPGMPAVLYATENQADGLYFLSRSEVDVKRGYLNLDIGGSTADLSLWLDGRSSASIECSLLMGCRQMLFASLMEHHAQDFEDDFEDEALRGLIRQITQAYRAEGSTTRGSRKCMLLLDDLLASHAQPLRSAMAQCRAGGSISYLECLLLMHIGFLFYLAGDVLNRAYRDDALRPLLPEQMEMCIAGNGGQLMRIFDDEQRTRLCSLTLARLDGAHPLKVLLPIQSSHPKQEVARGLLHDDSSLQSTLRSMDRWNGTGDGDSENLTLNFLMLFYHVFPQAAQRIASHIFCEEGGRVLLTSTAAMEMATVFANESARMRGDDMAMHVRCLQALKRLWHI